MLTRSARAALGAVVPLLAAAASAQSFDIQSFPTPNPGPFTNIFSAIAAPSDDEAWATGDFLGPPGAKEQTLAARFDGTSWVLVPSANQGSQQDDLTGVAAPAPGDAWAVGGSMFTNGTQITLIEHWDGAKFVIVPSPNPTGTTGNSRLNAIVALASDDIWAGGEAIIGSNILPLIEHWDGVQWSIVPTTVNTGFIFVNGIAAVGPNDIWAVGEDDFASVKPFAMHWNGSQWTQVPVPSPAGGGDTRLRSVSADASGTVFAVGSSGNERTLAERWTGSAWVIVPTIDVNNQDRLFGVSVRGPDDVLVAGSAIMPSGNQTTLVEWFDGTSFQLVPSPNPDPSNTPWAMAAPPCGPRWIVGGGVKPPKLLTLALRAAGPGGPVVDLGGGCGAGGQMAVVGPVSLGSSVVLQLVGADPGASVGLLNIAGVGPATGCGPCALVPYSVLVLLPLAGGGTELSAAIPCEPGLLGASAVLQWTVGPTAATGCAVLGPHRALSNAVQLTIGS